MSFMLIGLLGILQTPGAQASGATFPDQAQAAACDAIEESAGRDARDLHNLATCYFRGEGRARDLAQARALYAQAAELGFTKAMCALGNMMIDGSGGATDVAGGLTLCRQAAEAGEADAQTDLGNYLLVGQIVTRDVVEARRWYALAAEQGQANAAFVLGQIYWNGDGVAKDNAEAARWWRMAHDAGRPDAAYLLGREGFVRLMQDVAQPDDADRALLVETLTWFERAQSTDPAETNRQSAAQAIALLRELQAASNR